MAQTPKDLAASSNVVMACVTNDEAQEAVMFGPDGALVTTRPGTLVIDLSTVSPAASRRLHQACKDQGIRMIDAAVSGSVPQVEQGSLVIFVGGEQETYQQCKSLLDVLGSTNFYMGKSGMGTTMKLVVNTLLGTGMQALAEAITLGEKAGIEKGLLLRVLRQTAVLTPGQKAKLDNVSQERYPTAFALSLMDKDLALIEQMAGSVSVSMPVTAATHQVSTAALAREGDGDFSILVKFMEEQAGLTA